MSCWRRAIKRKMMNRPRYEAYEDFREADCGHADGIRLRIESTACSLTLFLTTSSASSRSALLSGSAACNHCRQPVQKKSLPFKILARAPRQFQTTRHGRVRNTAASGRIPEAAIPSRRRCSLVKPRPSRLQLPKPWTIFPPGCFAEPRGRDLPRGLYPVLFRELALCGGERRLAFANRTFWYRPRSQISVAPERASRMAEQNLDTASCRAVRARGPALRLFAAVFLTFGTLFVLIGNGLRLLNRLRQQAAGAAVGLLAFWQYLL